MLEPLRFFALCLAGRRGVLYVALSGGRGQAIDLVYVAIARLFRQPIFVHHHSFAYINAASLLNKCFFAFARDAVHIVLSRGMGTALTQRYGLDSRKLQVLSNAAFYKPADSPAAESQEWVASPIHIGYLSNITSEKGFVEFFDILATLRQQGIDFRAHIGGPVAADCRARFEQLLGAAADVEYYGAIYGERKELFYRRLDVFILPTKYANEAEPLVLYEAMQAGAYAIACDRGAIGEMLGNGAGLVLPAEAIVNGASLRIKELAHDHAALTAAQLGSLRRMDQIRAAASIDLKCLLASMKP